MKVGGVVVGSWAQGAPNRTLITSNRARYPINKQRVQKGGRVTIQAPGNQNCYRIVSNMSSYNYNIGVHGHASKSVQKLRGQKGQKLSKTNTKGGSAINKSNLKNKTKTGVTATEEKRILKKTVEIATENGVENLTENVEKMSLKIKGTITDDASASCKENG